MVEQTLTKHCMVLPSVGKSEAGKSTPIPSYCRISKATAEVTGETREMCKHLVLLKPLDKGAYIWMQVTYFDGLYILALVLEMGLTHLADVHTDQSNGLKIFVTLTLFLNIHRSEPHLV